MKREPRAQGFSHHRHSTRLWLVPLALLFVVLFCFTPGVRAQGPITAHTIVSRNGNSWNAPATTEIFFSAYAPPANSGSASTNLPKALSPLQLVQPRDPGSVIGPDGRERVQNPRDLPYRAIVLIQVRFGGGFYAECSGWIISARVVATAGHCVEDPGLGWAKSARVYAGLDGDTAVGSARAREFYTVNGWLDTHQPEFDYGAILLDAPLGDKTGWIGMVVLDNTALLETTMRITGYPADKPAHTMWTMTGPIKRAAPMRLFYAIDTYAGQSGSPVYNAQPTRACRYCAVAIHGYGVGGDVSGQYNSGVRITRLVLDNYLTLRKLQ